MIFAAIVVVLLDDPPLSSSLPVSSTLWPTCGVNCESSPSTRYERFGLADADAEPDGEGVVAPLVPVALAAPLVACVSVNFVSLAGAVEPVVPVAPRVPAAGVARSRHPVMVILLASDDGFCAVAVCGDAGGDVCGCDDGDELWGACANAAIVIAHVRMAHVPDHIRMLILSLLLCFLPRIGGCNVRATDDSETAECRSIRIVVIEPHIAAFCEGRMKEPVVDRNAPCRCDTAVVARDSTFSKY